MLQSVSRYDLHIGLASVTVAGIHIDQLCCAFWLCCSFWFPSDSISFMKCSENPFWFLLFPVFGSGCFHEEESPKLALRALMKSYGK